MGSLITINLSVDGDVNAWIGKSVYVMSWLIKWVWGHKHLTFDTNLQFADVCTKKHISVHRQESKLNVYHMRCRRKILGITTTGSAILHLMTIVFICVTCNRDCHSVAPQVTTDVVSQWSVIPSSHYTEGDRWWILSWVFAPSMIMRIPEICLWIRNPGLWNWAQGTRNPVPGIRNPQRFKVYLTWGDIILSPWGS